MGLRPGSSGSGGGRCGGGGGGDDTGDGGREAVKAAGGWAGLSAVPGASAYFAGGVNFGGGICSANITRDKTGLPDGLTLAHFLSAMDTGHDFRAPKKLLAFMPWPYFRDMSASDLTAIYEYLRAIPANKTPKCP